MLVKGKQSLRSRTKGAQTVRDASVIATLLYANLVSAFRSARAVVSNDGEPGTIVIGGREMELRYLGVKAIEAVYKGAVLIWEAVSSCFGSGMWINTRPWSNDDAWNNG